MNLDEQRYEALLNDPVAPALIQRRLGEELSIRDLALLVKRITSFDGELLFDRDKPDGTPRKQPTSHPRTGVAPQDRA